MTDRPDLPDDDREARAAEYVLGTLSGEDRLAFEAEFARDSDLRGMVAHWAKRLQPLADSAPAMAPPQALRGRVLDRVAGSIQNEPKPFSVARWLAWTFGVSALAGIAAVALVFLFTPRAPEIGAFALLHDAKGSSDVITFQIDRKREDMVILAQATPPESGRDYELWVVPPNKAPVSLGVVKAGVREERTLPAAATAYLTANATLAVSLEPAGGSPSGAPTGPILFTGNVELVP
jgi:anti-sigma-K factor RskA